MGQNVLLKRGKIPVVMHQRCLEQDMRMRLYVLLRITEFG